jgi:glucosylceramidase
MNIKSIVETAKNPDGSTGTGERLSVIKPEDRLQESRNHLACTIRIDRERGFQRIEGFGGALTESAGFALSRLPPDKRQEVLAAYFSPDKHGYTLARTHLNSCDFSLRNWACVEQPDESLASFSMTQSDLYITPLIRDANACLGRDGGLKLMVTPWSPPGWMKDNGEMNHGGKLFKRYYPLWAKYIVRYLSELKKRGIAVWAVSVQNEPAAAQTWDSCIFSAVEEAEFAAAHLGPALEEFAGTADRVKILVWDHNRDMLWERFSESMSQPGADKYIDGAAYHWYSGDQYEAVAQVSQAYPGKVLLFTEGSIEGGPRPGAWFSGERYAHNIINDLNHGCTGWIDWNIALDLQGGPNHVGNCCDAPVLVDTENGVFNYQSSYYYIGHFSRFIRPQAQRLAFTVDSYMTPATVDGRLGNMAEFCAFKNTDGSLALVVLNRTEADLVYELCIGSEKVIVRCPPRGIQTLSLPA